MKFLLNSKKLIYSIDELKKLNLSLYKINLLVKEGKLNKINKKNYENVNFNGDFNEFYFVQGYIERGVICLISAASYYNLTSIRPMEVDVAIWRKDKVYTMPEWPETKIFYFQKERYETGVKEINDSFNSFKIYDLEKTVVDIVYYKNKIGIEDIKEIIHNYLKHPDRNLNNLYKYSKLFGCEDTIKKYMEVLL
ncbi:MAG: type IV toxin-antitoxin system AbiEi family antitoxin domain-containing protein [Thomasclavelia sp.]